VGVLCPGFHKGDQVWRDCGHYRRAYIWVQSTSHTTLRRRVMICRMHQKVRSRVTHRLQQRWVESDYNWATHKHNSMEGSQRESTGAKAMSHEKVCLSIVSGSMEWYLVVKLLSIEISVISGKCKCPVSGKCWWYKIDTEYKYKTIMCTR